MSFAVLVSPLAGGAIGLHVSGTGDINDPNGEDRIMLFPHGVLSLKQHIDAAEEMSGHATLLIAATGEVVISFDYTNGSIAGSEPAASQAELVEQLIDALTSKSVSSFEDVTLSVGETSEPFESRGFAKVSVYFTAYVNDEYIVAVIQASSDGLTWADFPGTQISNAGTFVIECPPANFLRLKFSFQYGPVGPSTISAINWYAI